MTQQHTNGATTNIDEGDINIRLNGLEGKIERGFGELVAEIRALRNDLVAAVVGKNQISVEVVKIIFVPIIRALCWAMVVLIVWLTGFKSFMPHLFP